MTTSRLAALVALAVAVSVTGCTVGPDFVRPDIKSPAAWRIDYPKAAEVANTRWWEQFGDPALNTLIETALRQMGGNQTKASAMLGLRVQTLNMKLKRFRELGQEVKW